MEWPKSWWFIIMFPLIIGYKMAYIPFCGAHTFQGTASRDSLGSQRLHKWRSRTSSHPTSAPRGSEWIGHVLHESLEIPYRLMTIPPIFNISNEPKFWSWHMCIPGDHVFLSCRAVSSWVMMCHDVRHDDHVHQTTNDGCRHHRHWHWCLKNWRRSQMII
jgi:hypothetical protein